MKKIITLLFSLAFAIGKPVLSQNLSEKNHFELIKVAPSSSQDNILKMINVLNLEGYRLIDKRRLIEFADGSLIELFSANELMEKYQRMLNPANKVWTPNLPIIIIRINPATGRPEVSEKH